MKNPKTPHKPAQTVPARARSREKGARRAPARRYTVAEKAAAVELVAASGMAAAHRELGIPKSTLHKWVKAAGVDLGEEARARTAVATEAVRARAAVVQASTLELLEGHIAQAGAFLATVAGVNAAAAQRIAGADPDKIEVNVGIAGPYAVVTDEAAAELSKVALALDGLPLAVRDAEGILTRAIHDLQLLRGEATERGELVVDFTVPRPVAPDGPVPEIAVDDD